MLINPRPLGLMCEILVLYREASKRGPETPNVDAWPQALGCSWVPLGHCSSVVNWEWLFRLYLGATKRSYSSVINHCSEYFSPRILFSFQKKWPEMLAIKLGICFDVWRRAAHRRQKSKKMIKENLAFFPIFGGVLRTAAKNRKICFWKSFPPHLRM